MFIDDICAFTFHPDEKYQSLWGIHVSEPVNDNMAHKSGLC
jgi:hypothetical protein